MTSFSIVVPVLGDTAAFEQTLATVLRESPSDSQIIVPHDGSYRDVYHLADEVKFIVSPTGRLVEYWNRTLSVAHGRIIAWFSPGLELTEGWSEAVSKSFSDSRIASVVPRVVGFAASQSFRGISVETNGTRRVELESSGRLSIAGGMIGPSLAAAFYRNDSLGWLPALSTDIEDIYLDAEIALGLRGLGFETAAIELELTITELNGSGNQPHGCSATRAMTRHKAVLQPQVSGVRADLGAVLQGQTWRLKHAFGRLRANRFRRDDRAFARQLVANRRSIEEMSASRKSAAYRRVA
jgi:hypothetical protein